MEGASSGSLGLPVPGVELKLVPVEDKLEARLRGPSITPGFWRRPELTAAAFDEEGYYRLGDAIKFADPQHPLKGFVFDGRLNEDFKNSTGTWVRVGPLRMRLLAHFGSLVQDVVLAGPDRDFTTALFFLDCRRTKQRRRFLRAPRFGQRFKSGSTHLLRQARGAPLALNGRSCWTRRLRSKRRKLLTRVPSIKKQC
jgi:feruloyl-CoA synthase